jgi:hypothetical protein
MLILTQPKLTCQVIVDNWIQCILFCSLSDSNKKCLIVFFLTIACPSCIFLIFSVFQFDFWAVWLIILCVDRFFCFSSFFIIIWNLVWPLLDTIVTRVVIVKDLYAKNVFIAKNSKKWSYTKSQNVTFESWRGIDSSKRYFFI